MPVVIDTPQMTPNITMADMPDDDEKTEENEDMGDSINLDNDEDQVDKDQ